MAELVIRFYSTADEYGEFSNFAHAPIRLKNRTWPTAEHYFQAQKFAGTDDAHAEAIRKAGSPMIAARMGRDRKKKLRRDWESVKVGVMREALMAKFEQHDHLRELLLSTATPGSWNTPSATTIGAMAATDPGGTCLANY